MSAYNNTSKIIHWLVAALALAMLSFSFFLPDVPISIKPIAYTIHKSLGLTILAIMIFRVFWQFFHKRPNLPHKIKSLKRTLPRAIQYGLYVFLILMPLSGWIMATASKKIPLLFGLIAVPCPGINPNPSVAKFMNSSHKTIAWILIALVLIHIADGLRHYFWKKDKYIQKMLF